jgi:pyruvate dehydrogenase E2 component (dihydrolipoamide acetyltransferase)
MPIYIEMPKLSDTMTEGTLVKWRKKQGDKVESGDILAEVETDKATMEMEAFDDGILSQVYVEEGQKVSVGQRLALLLAPGEEPPADAGGKTPAPASPRKREDAPQPTAASKAEPAGGKRPDTKSGPAASATHPASGRVKSSPLARKLAAEKGIDLSGISGTGPGGRIVQRDVLSARPGGASGGQQTAGSARIPATPAGEGDQRIPLSGMRRTIADRLLASKTQIPHFYLSIEVDAAELMKLRSEVNASAEKEGLAKLTVNDFALKATIVAAQKVPKVNAAFDGDAVVQYANINLAVAVAVEDGLVTPVIRDAQRKSLREISETVKDLANRARGKKLKPEEYQGGTITVSNLGSYGIDSFFAIINPPQAAILSIGAIVRKPVVNAAGEIVVGQRMSIGFSCDHRVVDGAIGAEYLGHLRQLIENPALMLI